MKKSLCAVSLLFVLASGCIGIKAGFYPDTYKAGFQGWLKGYASYKEFPQWDGTILKIATFDDSSRPGEFLTLDIPFLAGIGLGPLGARVRVLPFAIGLGTLAYDPKPRDSKKEKPAKKEHDKERTKK